MVWCVCLFPRLLLLLAWCAVLAYFFLVGCLFACCAGCAYLLACMLAVFAVLAVVNKGNRFEFTHVHFQPVF